MHYETEKISKDIVENKLALTCQRIKDIKNRYIDEVCTIGIIDIENWEWAQGVGLYGLFKSYLRSKKEEDLNWIINWIEKNIKNGLPSRNVNTTSPLLTVSSVAQTTGNKKYMQICSDWAKWIMSDLPRTEYNGFQHFTTDGLQENELWDDTLFMAVLFLAKMGVIEENKEYLDECERQFLIHANYLMDKKTGLWYHGWTFNEYNHFAKALWGRGNCWVTIFIPDYIELTGISCGSKHFMADTLVAQVDALAQYQHESGMWHTLINDSTSYLEASATAGFAYGILKSVRLGIISDKYYEVGLKGAKAVLENIDSNGTVKSVSYGTGMGHTLQHYKEIPICPMPYGQALAILLLDELLHHTKG
ncbi:MAG: glycoside hydrolase family 88 protein [Firmicutes bacterium]|nr:glycoside hydrolase family 88 protein [Bacillota bacterium]